MADITYLETRGRATLGRLDIASFVPPANLGPSDEMLQLLEDIPPGREILPGLLNKTGELIPAGTWIWGDTITSICNAVPHAEVFDDRTLLVSGVWPQGATIRINFSPRLNGNDGAVIFTAPRTVAALDVVDGLAALLNADGGSGVKAHGVRSVPASLLHVLPQPLRNLVILDVSYTTLDD